MIAEGLLDSISAITINDGALAGALARLAEAFDCRSAALVDVDPLRPAGDVAQSCGIFTGEAVRRYEAYAFHHRVHHGPHHPELMTTRPQGLEALSAERRQRLLVRPPHPTLRSSVH